MRGLLRVGLALLVGCGRIGYAPGTSDDAPGPESDASDGAPGPDGAPDACALGPWSAPMPLANVGSAQDEFSPALGGDGRALVFSSDRSGTLGGEDLYLATRASTADPFGPPENLTDLNSTGTDGSSTLSADGLTLFFSSDRGGSMRLYVATRPRPGAPFGAPAEVAELAGEQVVGASLSQDGTELYYNHLPPLDLFRAVRVAGQFTVTGPIAELNGATSEGYPSISSDGLQLYFETDRADPRRDVFVATRVDTGGTFDIVTRVDGVSIDGESDVDPEISRDGTTLLLSSDRVGPDYDLYVSTRGCQ